ncbi:hypothetical protein J421_1566 [Gemmatirosa kalamazoonensis]|uniref:Uncharacterized protein n=1 Tax=Gemmatirosa kalamazoonensis TaxID=861299 RepID=W0RI69_9BACT|nr:hypothetical protein [Gemmatirosa kalamazoonensis]AHG89103.1 hypothetical protein J421_1566 [Gemmatirosa kalamazoonensis]
MPSSPLSPAFLAPTLATVAAFAPPAAAGWARRSFLGDPAGQVATCWLVTALVGLANFVAYFYHWLPRSFPLFPFAFGVMPLLLAPPLLTWIGRDAARWRWAFVAAWLAITAALLAALGTGREFVVVMDPLMSALLAALSLWALAAQVRRAPASIARHDWFWILVGQVTYFATNMIRVPLVETLVARHWAAAIAVSNGIMLLYCVSYVVIARGMLVRDPEPRAVRLAAPSMGAA